MSRQEIFKQLIKQRLKIKSFGVKKLGLFGSFANGTSKNNSDIDFIVEFNSKTFDNYMDLKFFLESQFNRKVDLVMPNTIKPTLKPLILKQVKYAKGL
jgi:hypothetical protein